jgi:DNA repair protein RadC
MVLALNTRHRLIKRKNCIRDAQFFISAHSEIFEFAILQHASAIILAHNHPSGEAHPSRRTCASRRKCARQGNPGDQLAGSFDHCAGQYRSLKKEQRAIFEKSDKYT